jgi:hypothetical protein
VANPSGTLLAIGGRYSDEDRGFSGSNKRFETRLFARVEGGLPTPVRATMQDPSEQPHSIFWSEILRAFVVSSWRGDAVIKSSTTLIRDGEAQSLSRDEGADLVQDLPRFGVAALLRSGSLSFVDVQDRLTFVTGLNSGDDHEGWEAVYETRDAGWIYVSGAEYDHAVRVQRDDGRLRASRIVRIREDDGMLQGVMRTLLGIDREQMRRDGLSALVTARRCRRFSTAVQRMIFCDGPMRNMRAGEIVDIAPERTRLTDFIGDADRLGLALFREASGRLFAYDGERLHPVAGPVLGSRGTVHDLRNARRTFIATFNGLFELKGSRSDRLKLTRVDTPAAQFLLTRFVDNQDGDVIAFLQNGIYLVRDGRLHLQWTDQGRSIDVTGPTAPTEVRGWGGTIFNTSAGAGKDVQFHFLSSCRPTRP